MSDTIPLSSQGLSKGASERSSKRASKKISQRLFRARPDDVLPLNIEHQRIYIVPSKRGLAFLVALTVCLIASINYQLNLGYALSFLLSGLFFASLLHTYKNLAGITLESIHSYSVAAGETTKFVLRLSNNSSQDRIGIDVKYGNQFARTDLLAESTTTLELPVVAEKRGYLPLGRLTFNSQYPVSLWTTWSYCHSPANVIVHPKPEQNPPALPQAFSEGDADTAQQSFEGDVAGLRDYVPGDALTHIAWKRAARMGGHGGLHVRELEQNQLGGDIELSLGHTNVHGLETQLSRLAAWVNEATQSGAPFSLTLSDNTIALGSGDAHRQHCMDALGAHKVMQPGADS